MRCSDCYSFRAGCGSAILKGRRREPSTRMGGCRFGDSRQRQFFVWSGNPAASKVLAGYQNAPSDAGIRAVHFKKRERNKYGFPSSQVEIVWSGQSRIARILPPTGSRPVCSLFNMFAPKVGFAPTGIRVNCAYKLEGRRFCGVTRELFQALLTAAR